TVESDKASMEIPASTGGVVKSISVKVGDKVAEGSVVLEVEAADAAAPAAKEAPKAEAPKQAAAAPAAKAEAAAPAASSGPVEIEVPDIGDFKEVEVIEV
ncbi:biotin/lipoyl-containing protein, partial [Achromobacter ruhlandii]